MKKAIKKIVESLFPELVGNYHLPIKAKIVAIADAPIAPSLCDQYRPHYAVDVLPLLPNGEPNPELGIFEGVELPILGNTLAVPLVGTFVELAFFNGLPSQPFIRSIRPEGMLLPDHARGETNLFHSLDSFYKIDSAGNHHRTTSGDINDQAIKILSEALTFIGNYKTRTITNTGDDTEDIKGSKLIEALGNIDILSGEKISIGALKVLALRAEKEATIESATSVDLTAPKISIGDGENELLALVKDLSDQVKTLITDVKTIQAAYNDHVHTGNGTVKPATQVTATAASVASMQTGLGKICKVK